MENDESEPTRKPFIGITGPEDAKSLDFWINVNLVSGVPLVGDEIAHKETGRKFVVVKRTWPSDPNRDIPSLMLTLEELKPAPATTEAQPQETPQGG